MGFLSNLFGRKQDDLPPPPPMPPPPRPPTIESKLITPLEHVPGVVAALAAMRAGERGPVEKLYLTTHDSGLRHALIRRVVDDAPVIPGPSTPFDSAANDGDPLWQSAVGMYHIRIGWKARGSDTADKVTEQGWETLTARCELAVSALEDAAAMRPDDDVPLVFLMGAARGLSDKKLGERAFLDAVARSPNSWAAAQQRVEWLSPRWFGSIEDVLAYARYESQRVGTGELAALPILAHNDINLYHVAFEEDRQAAANAREAAADEIRDCLARSVDAPGAPTTYATTIIRHFGGSLLWQVADEDGAKAQLSKVGRVFEPWCWLQNEKAYTNVRSRLGLG
jgi:hypothetical protein